MLGSFKWHLATEILGLCLSPLFSESSILFGTLYRLIPISFQDQRKHSFYLKVPKYAHTHPATRIYGKGQTWTPGPWTTSLDRVHGPLFFILKKNSKKKHTTHIESLLFFNCVCYFVSRAIDHFKLRPRKRFSLPQVKAKH